MQDEREITFYPGLDLSECGKTPTGKALFRVVLASSRIDRCYSASTGIFHVLPMYMHDGWMLEKWLSAQEFAGTPEAFEEYCKTIDLKKKYPTDGEYDAVHPFQSNEEVGLALEYARLAKFGKERMTPAEREKVKAFHREQKEKAIRDERSAIIRDAAPSRFGRVAEKHKFYNEYGREIQV